MQISQQKLREKIREILRREGLSYEAFGKSIGISKNMVSLMLMEKKRLGRAKTNEFCEVWGVDPESLVGEDWEIELSVEEIISDVMYRKGIENDQLAEKTNISMLRISRIRRVEEKATREEVEKICAALGVDFVSIDKSTIATSLRIIEERMKRMYLSEEFIEKIMEQFANELKNRRDT